MLRKQCKSGDLESLWLCKFPHFGINKGNLIHKSTKKKKKNIASSMSSRKMCSPILILNKWRSQDKSILVKETGGFVKSNQSSFFYLLLSTAVFTAHGRQFVERKATNQSWNSNLSQAPVLWFSTSLLCSGCCQTSKYTGFWSVNYVHKWRCS